jgi:hypothetical protein
MKQTIKKSLQDIFSKDVILFVLQVGLVSLILSSLFVWYFWEGLSSIIASYISWIPWEWLQNFGAKIMTFVLAYMIFIITVSLLTSLYSEKLLITLAKKHYPDVMVIGTANISTSILLTLKASAVFLFFFMLGLAFIFIPILGQVVLLYLWSILLREPTMYDVSALFIADKEVIREKKKGTRVLAMLASLFNYMPLLNAFAPVFSQILFLHHLLGKEK